MSENPCPICGTKLLELVHSSELNKYSCSACGEFLADPLGIMNFIAPHPEIWKQTTLAALSHRIRTKAGIAFDGATGLPCLTSVELERLSRFPPTLPVRSEQKRNLIVLIGNHQREEDAAFRCNHEGLRALVGAASAGAFIGIRNDLWAEKFIERNESAATGTDILSLTSKGWDYWEEQKNLQI